MRAARVDTNHAEIVNALRQRGATVQSLAKIGKGAPDLLVGYLGKNFLMEVKDRGTQYGKKGLNANQRRWFETWRGRVYEVASIEDALAVLKRVEVVIY
jgi:hypothetical protein